MGEGPQVPLKKRVSSVLSFFDKFFKRQLLVYQTPIPYASSPITRRALAALIVKNGDNLNVNTENIRLAVGFFLLDVESTNDGISTWQQNETCPKQIKGLSVPKKEDLDEVFGLVGCSFPSDEGSPIDRFNQAVNRLCLETQFASKFAQRHPQKRSELSSKISQNMGVLKRLFDLVPDIWGIREFSDRELADLYMRLTQNKQFGDTCGKYTDPQNLEVIRGIKSVLNLALDHTKKTVEDMFDPKFYAHIDALVKAQGQALVDVALREEIDHRQEAFEELRQGLKDTRNMEVLEAQIVELTEEIERAERTIQASQAPVGPQVGSVVNLTPLLPLIVTQNLWPPIDDERTEPTTGVRQMSVASDMTPQGVHTDSNIGFRDDTSAETGEGDLDSVLETFLALTGQHGDLQVRFDQLRKKHDKLNLLLMQPAHFGDMDLGIFQQKLSALQKQQETDKSAFQAVVADIEASNKRFCNLLMRSEKAVEKLHLDKTALSTKLEVFQTKSSSLEVQILAMEAAAQRTESDKDKSHKVSVRQLKEKAAEDAALLINERDEASRKTEALSLQVAHLKQQLDAKDVEIENARSEGDQALKKAQDLEEALGIELGPMTVELDKYRKFIRAHPNVAQLFKRFKE